MRAHHRHFDRPSRVADLRVIATARGRDTRGLHPSVKLVDVAPPGVRICLDRDCPGCGWPEMMAVGSSIDAGPDYVVCGNRPPCGWSAEVVAS